MALQNMVTIGGKDRPVSFSYGAIYEFEEISYGRTLAEKFNLESLSRQRALCFMGLKWGLYEPDKKRTPKPDFTIEEVGEWIINEPEAKNKILLFFAQEYQAAFGSEKKSEEAAEPVNQ